MYLFGISVQWISILLHAWIFVLIVRRGLSHRFPIFTAYIAYGVVEMVLRSIFLSNPAIYFYVFWITAPLEMTLMVLAAHESFLRVFRGFYLLWWFRVLFPGAIAGSLVYSAWRGYTAPAFGASARGAAIVAAALAAQHVVLAIAILFFGLAMLLRVPRRIHEYRIILGFAISALAVAFAGTVRSTFGTSFRFLSEDFPAVAYLVVLAVWLSAVLPTEPSSEVLQQGPSVAQLINEMRRQLAWVRTFLGRGSRPS